AEVLLLALEHLAERVQAEAAVEERVRERGAIAELLGDRQRERQIALRRALAAEGREQVAVFRVAAGLLRRWPGAQRVVRGEQAELEERLRVVLEDGRESDRAPEVRERQVALGIAQEALHERQPRGERRDHALEERLQELADRADRH